MKLSVYLFLTVLMLKTCHSDDLLQKFDDILKNDIKINNEGTSDPISNDDSNLDIADTIKDLLVSDEQVQKNNSNLHKLLKQYSNEEK